MRKFMGLILILIACAPYALAFNTFEGIPTGENATFAGMTLTTTPLNMASGGSNKGLTASNGGLIYSDGDSMEVLAGTATAGQIPRSGLSSAPTWSTATYPATIGAGDILGGTALNVIGAITDLPTATTIGTAYVYRVGGTDVSQPDGGLAMDVSAATDGQMFIGDTGVGMVLGTIAAVANQTTVSGGAGTLTVGTVQDIGTGSSPTFAVVKLGDGTAALPSLAFANDLNSGLWRGGEDSYYFSAGGGSIFQITTAGVGTYRMGTILPNEDASATNPTVTPGGGLDLDTGLGSAAADQISVIAGGVELARGTEGTLDSFDIKKAFMASSEAISCSDVDDTCVYTAEMMSTRLTAGTDATGDTMTVTDGVVGQRRTFTQVSGTDDITIDTNGDDPVLADVGDSVTVEYMDVWRTIASHGI